jgi:hypothetical protein
MDERDSTAAILSRTLRLLRLNARVAAISIAVLAALGFVLNGSLVVGGAIGIIAQYANTQRVLSELDLLPGGYQSPPFFPMLGLSLLTYLAYAFGLALLVVPGIILVVRWSISVPVLIAEEPGVIGALRGSWQATEGRFWPILGALAVPIVPMVAVSAGLILSVHALGPRTVNALVSLVANGLMVVVWYVAAAIYARPVGHLERLGEVFA